MTDEPREIAPCPMPGCVDCDYRFGRSLPTRSDAIAAHNALCADVQRGREAEKIEQERDALRAEVERLREALKQIAGFDDVLDYKRGWDAAEIAQAALDAGKSQ